MQTMPTIYRDIGYSLTHIIEDIKHGKIALPDIQRPFVWSNAKVRDLMDSMYRGYPVGTLMFWETGAEVGTRQVGGGPSDRAAKLLIVDGQQRITSLFAVMTGTEVLTQDFRRKRIRLAFSPVTETFAVTDAAIEKDPSFVPDITELWGGAYRSVTRAFFKRLEDARGAEFGDDDHDALEARIDRVRDLKDFRFQVIELGESAGEEQVAEIFVRINSEGVQLNQADFILTLMSVYWEKGRRELETFSRQCVDPVVTGPSPKNKFIEPSPDQLLRCGVGLAFGRGKLSIVYSLLRGKDLDTGEVSASRRDSQFLALDKAQQDVLNLTHWHEFLKCIERAGFRNRKMISSENALIYSYTMWLVGKCRFGLDYAPLRSIIARWFFMVHTTGRYTTSPESSIESDLRRIERLESNDGHVFVQELDRIIRSNFTGDYWSISLAAALDSSSSRSPGLFAYWAALNILDADALFSDVRVKDLIDRQADAKKGIERHHLFPRAHLKDKGVTATSTINAIANLAFMDWPENNGIRDAAPRDYWPEVSGKISQQRLTRQVHWHALPTAWYDLEYNDFLERRRSRMAAIVREGFESLSEPSAPISNVNAISDLIAMDESQTLEFKETARWNVRASKQDPKIEHVVLKTVAGFLNAEGGQLLIGVRDDHSVAGLGPDYATLRKQDRDGLELWLRQHLDVNLSASIVKLVRIVFERVGDADIARITVAPSGKPVFAKGLEGNEHNEFWVRVGNQTKQLHGDEMFVYHNTHWS